MLRYAMADGLKLNVVVLTQLLAAVLNKERLDDAMDVLKLMQKQLRALTSVFYSLLLVV